MLYKIFHPLKENDEVVYIGCYVLKWDEGIPTVGFAPASKEEIEQAAKDITEGE